MIILDIRTFTAKVFTLLIILVFIYPTLLLADPNANITFQHLSVQNGLVDDNVKAFLEDSHGFLWIGTQNGLSRFDGYSFENYTPGGNDKISLLGEHIRVIREDYHGNIWLATNTGISCFHTREKKFTHYPAMPEIKGGLPNNNIQDIELTSKNDIFIGTGGNGLVHFNVKTQTFTQIEAVDKGGHEYNYHLLEISQISKNILLLVYGNGKISAYNILTGEYKLLNNYLDAVNVSNGYQLAKIDSLSYALFNGNLKGYYRLELKHEKTMVDISNLVFYDSPEIHNIIDFITDSNDEWWVSLNGEGILRHNPKTHKNHHYSSNQVDNSSISSDIIICLYEDRLNNIWVGTQTHGISVYYRNRYKFELLRNKVNDPNSLVFNNVTSVFVDADNMLWIGTDGRGVNRYNPKTGIFELFSPEGEGIYNMFKTGKILSITQDNNRNLYFGEWGNGLIYYNPTTHEKRRYNITPLNDNENNLAGNNIWHVYADSKDQIWITTIGMGLMVFNPADESLKSYTSDVNDPYSIPDNFTFDVLEDNKNRIWVSTAGNGFCYLDTKTGKFTNYPEQADKASGLQSKLVWSLYEDSKNNLWVGTSQGLHKMLDMNGNFEVYTTAHGLAGNEICMMREDQHGNLWIGTNNGLTKFDPISGECVNFTENEGLQGPKFNYHRPGKFNDGSLVFCGTKGVNIFHPDSIKLDSVPPRIVFTKFSLFNKEVYPKQQYNNQVILHEAIEYTDSIELNHLNNVFTIEFSALHFSIPEENKYKYKLIGFDNSWKSTGTSRRFATYTNLNPGNYTFIVTASNPDGVWNKEGIHLHIKILPPWWATWWFRSIVIITLMAVIIGYYFYRIYQFKTQKRYLEAEIDKHTKELKNKNLQLSEQAESLNETNTIMEERQQIIEEQSEELRVQKELVEDNNEILKLQKKELEIRNAELDKLNATKNTLFSIISHDLKNPFSTVLGLLDLLKINFDKYNDAKKRQFIEMVQNSAKNIYALLENLLEWSRSQTESTKYEPTELYYASLVNNLFQLVKDMAAKKNIELISEVDDNLMIYADKNMINTVTRNLVTNAIKFTDSGKVTVSAKEFQHHVIIEVSDTGMGIPAEKAGTIFEVQKNKSTKGTQGEAGTGLGLIICKEFIDAHNGKISVSSEISTGSTFKIELPRKTS